MRPNIEVMCIVKFQYATLAMLALPFDHFLVSLLFLDALISVIVPSLLLISFLNVLFNLHYPCFLVNIYFESLPSENTK